MRRLLVPLALAGALGACSDGGSVDADAIRGPELAAVRTALDSAFLHDTTLDRAFTGDSGFYALLAALVFPFIDRASRIAEGVDTTRIVGIEFDIDATQGGTQVVSNLTVELAWKGYDSTLGTVDTVFFLLGSGRAPITDSLWTRLTLDTAGTGTGFVVHQAADLRVTKWLSRTGHFRTTQSHYRSGQTLGGGSTAPTGYRRTPHRAVVRNAKVGPGSATGGTSSQDVRSRSPA